MFLLIGNVLFSNIHYFHHHHHSDETYEYHECDKCILIDNISFEKVSNFLKAEHFADPNHGHIFEALAKVIQRGQIGDPLTLKNYFESKDTLESIGGASYLAKLAEEAVLTSSAGEYGKIIHDLYKRRRLVFS